ncbi:MAG TPA: polysaccharide deacetylase family protein [Rhizomicrobium sp.]|jgi:cellulose synthase/poly-beta-1,6-N-acetylglucosamine synthase-like glycosyltransferase/peptidoglycan/xylan/chitin deacetylase (PgdA/CDA1 family)|nr:polysaccharide deacetylase family protein [Rhizomicrobium sp.]
MANKPVFFDVTGRRAARLSTLGWVMAIVSTVLGIGFAASLLVAQPDVKLDLPGRSVAVNPPQLVRQAVAPGLLKSAARLAAEARARRLEIQRLRHFRNIMPARVPAGLQPKKGRALAIGFYVNWGESADASFSSLKRALPRLDWVIPTWLTLDGPDLAFKPNLDIRSLTYIRTRKPDVAILPLLQNASGARWYGPELGKLLADPVRRASLVKNVVDFIAANKLQGVAVDFENVEPADHKNLETFLNEMSDAFTPHGWIIAQCAPFDDDRWPYKAYAGIVDYTVLMAYDEADDSAPPGPIAGEDWYERVLDRRMRQLPADSTIIAIGNYSYDWTQGEAAATTREFSEAMVAARDAGARIQFDDASNNPHFSYDESDGTKHTLWFLDAVTAYNQIHAADGYQPAGFALWRLGTEDPSVLPLLGRPYGAPPPPGLKTIPTNDDVDFDGEGEILRVESGPVTGHRDFRLDKDSGDIIDETYSSLPANYVIRRVGQAGRKLALTFDDGPDPEWTPQILDILKAKHAPATFFVIGANMEAHPGLVQRILGEGHEIGNHTYTHPNLADTPLAAVRLELNATQRLFEALTGRSMRLLRPPYLGDAEPSDADEIVPIEEAQKLGYVTIGTHVDTLDWKMLPVDEMMKLVLKEISDPNPDARGNIILMHDSGGDRSQTVKLLPVLIDTLRARGYSFVPVSELGGFKRDEVMPPQPLTVMLYENRLVFLTFSYLGQFLYYCFIAAIFLGVGRLLMLCGLALTNRFRKRHEPAVADRGHPVTVLIPAFNEERVIVTTVERILASDYRDLEVLVIDDGSKDHTAYIVRSHFRNDRRVGVISIANGGKAHALNVGLANAKGEVVVALDADTQFNPDTISRLVRWFDDPRVGAVAGNAKVGNRINMITRWQALEYIVAQNLERRALSALDTLTVVPGAVGAWRREALAKLGGFPGDTLAEDQDLTIAIQVAGYRALFDASAIAWTEAPATIRGLSKQRFRWAYGTLQCLWKYRRITFNPKFPQLGLVALPQVWLFQILLTTLAPLADLLLVWQLVGQWINYSQHGAEFQSNDLRTIGLYYCLFILVDLLAAAVGFLMERGEDWRLLWWLMLQRFGYRQIMYYVVVRSIYAALRGPFVGWGKLERQGTVRAPLSVKPAG